MLITLVVSFVSNLVITSSSYRQVAMRELGHPTTALISEAISLFALVGTRLELERCVKGLRTARDRFNEQLK